MDDEQNNLISKKTGKPKRVLTEKQLETLRIARENWQEKRRELKAQKMLTIDPQKKKFDEDKRRVETEIEKLKREIEEKLKLDYEGKLSAIKEEYESKFNEASSKFNEASSRFNELKAKEEIKQKYTKKPKKIIEVYSTQEEDTDFEDKPKFPIANKKKKSEDDDIKKFFF